MFADTHCHVNFNAYRDDSEEVVRRSLAEDVQMIVVGSQLDTSRRAVEIAEKFPEGVWASVALHPLHLVQQERDENELYPVRNSQLIDPSGAESAGVISNGVHFTTRAEKFDPEAYKTLAQRSKKVVAIGECGLDYYRMPAGHDERELKRLQRETLLQHIALAEELKLPLMVHCRDAYEDVYELLRANGRSLKGIELHSYIGNLEMAKKFLDLGCYLAFNGIITYKPRKEIIPGSAHPELQEVVKFAPLDRILLETDAPYLSPEPLRGRRNEPVNVKYVAEKIAELKRVSLKDVEQQTAHNAQALFRL
jgi:TatD DNase family protein